jgi:hypothetical protein
MYLNNLQEEYMCNIQEHNFILVCFLIFLGYSSAVGNFNEDGIQGR